MKDEVIQIIGCGGGCGIGGAQPDYPGSLHSGSNHHWIERDGKTIFTSDTSTIYFPHHTVEINNLTGTVELLDVHDWPDRIRKL